MERPQHMNKYSVIKTCCLFNDRYMENVDILWGKILIFVNYICLLTLSTGSETTELRGGEKLFPDRIGMASWACGDPDIRHHPLPDNANIQERHSGTPCFIRKSAIGLVYYCLCWLLQPLLLTSQLRQSGHQTRLEIFQGKMHPYSVAPCLAQKKEGPSHQVKRPLFLYSTALRSVFVPQPIALPGISPQRYRHKTPKGMPDRGRRRGNFFPPRY